MCNLYSMTTNQEVHARLLRWRRSQSQPTCCPSVLVIQGVDDMVILEASFEAIEPPFRIHSPNTATCFLVGLTSGKRAGSDASYFFMYFIFALCRVRRKKQ